VGKHRKITEIIIRASFGTLSLCNVATARDELVELKIHFPIITEGKNFLIITTRNKIKLRKKGCPKFTTMVSTTILSIKSTIYRTEDLIYPLLIITNRQSRVKKAS
jgi:hypothetical protein